MNLTRSHLEAAAHRGVIAPDQVEALWAFLSESTADTSAFRFTHILYYLGGLIAIGAMTLFMTLGWERFGGWGLFSIALAYALVLSEAHSPGVAVLPWLKSRWRFGCSTVCV